jgi:hypothetical protein
LYYYYEFLVYSGSPIQILEIRWSIRALVWIYIQLAGKIYQGFFELSYMYASLFVPPFVYGDGGSEHQEPPDILKMDGGSEHQEPPISSR